jgi:glutamate racemase
MLASSAAKPSYKFYATGDAKEFESLAKRFLGPEVNDVTHLERKAAND